MIFFLPQKCLNKTPKNKCISRDGREVRKMEKREWFFFAVSMIGLIFAIMNKFQLW